ncbi:hypothetical protein GCM10027345_26510 [Hymenobacter daeguensis]
MVAGRAGVAGQGFEQLLRRVVVGKALGEVDGPGFLGQQGHLGKDADANIGKLGVEHGVMEIGRRNGSVVLSAPPETSSMQEKALG